MEKKIKSCYYEVNGKKFLVGDNSELLMEIGKNHRFYIDFESDENFEAEFIKEKRRDIDIHCFFNCKLSDEYKSNLSCVMDEMFQDGIKKLHSDIFHWNK